MATLRNEYQEDNSKRFKRIVYGVSAVVVLILALSLTGSLVEDLSAKHMLVVQRISGKMYTYNTAGIKPQLFGKTTLYKKSFQFEALKTGEDGDQSIKVRFSDGGHATMSVSCRIDMPNDPAKLLDLHTRYGSQEAIENDLIQRQIEKAVYMTGSVMTSKESYSEKRPDLLFYIEDQAVKGVYKTDQDEVRDIDILTNEQRTRTIITIQKDTATGQFLRQEQSPLERFGITLYGFAINSIDYDATIESQITQQQEAYMAVQTAIMNSKKAEQDAITAEQKGKADAATAKWKQEVEKATAVTKAQQELEVQQLATTKAKEYKQQQIFEGEGEAEKKRLIMNADGALEKKLEAWVSERQFAWDAFAKTQAQLVPNYVSGGGGDGSTSAMQWMEIMGMKAAKDLNLDMSQKK